MTIPRSSRPHRAGAATAGWLPVMMALLAAACSPKPGEQGEQAAPSAPSAAAPKPAEPALRIAMSAAFVSEAGVPVYDRIVDYLAKKSGQEIELVTGFGYSTINSMLESGVVDIGFVCGLPYVLLHDRDHPAVDLLAAPVMKSKRYQGKPLYFADLIVRKDSSFQSLQDLQGRTYVYNEETSNVGYNMLRYRLIELGLTSGFFGKVVRSGSHEESIRMIADGRADVGSVSSLVLDYDRAAHLGVADQVRVIESIGPVGIPPVVVSSTVPREVRDTFRRHLLAMHEDPEGRAILDQARVDRFVSVDDRDYDDIRKMKRAAEDAGFTTIR